MNLEALLEPVPERSGKPCKLARQITDLDEPYKSALQKLVDTPWKAGGLSDAQLRERLFAAGIEMGQTVIHYHRRGICSCRKLVVA